MPLSDGLAIAGLALAAVTAIGVVATVVVTSLNRRDTTLYNSPAPSVMYGRLLDGSTWIDFEIKSAEGRPNWGVVSIDMPRNWRWRPAADSSAMEWSCAPKETPVCGTRRASRLISRTMCCGSTALPNAPPITRGIVLIHSDAPELLSLRYNICLSSAPSKRSSLVVRYRVQE